MNGRADHGSVALDEWRGIAMLLVLVSHGLYFTGRVGGAGRVGVNLFFFISGLLVYRSLERPGARRARRFWWGAYAVSTPRSRATSC